MTHNYSTLKKKYLKTVLFCDYPWSFEFIKKIIRYKSFIIVLVITSKKKNKTIIEKNKNFFDQKKIKLHITNSDTEILKFLNKHNIDLGISIAYSKIFKKKLLLMFKKSLLNIHPSYLPFRKGPDPIRNGIIKDDKFFGITLHIIEEQIDTGDIISQYKILNDNKSNVKMVLDKLGKKYFSIIISDIKKFIYSSAKIKKQTKLTKNSYSSRLIKKELIINNYDTLKIAVNKIRATLPYNNVYYRYKNKYLISKKNFSMLPKKNYYKYILKNKTIYIPPLNEKK
tara:strand:+ start:23347 stop:24195 length:849 start_codon:yes stop_codon:yes gene_type:complete